MSNMGFLIDRLRMHPRAATLNHYVDGALSPGQRRRISTHLLACRACRATVDSLAALQSATRALSDPPMSPTLLARMQERRLRGDNVLLPRADDSSHTTPLALASNSRVAAVAATVMIAVVGFFTLSGNNASASTRVGTMSFSTSTPRAGDTITIVYQAPSIFAREHALFARVRMYRLLASGVQQRTTAPEIQRVRMHDDGDGRFTGQFVLPVGVMMARMAVENEQASQVDSRARSYWTMLAHDAKGQPLFDALMIASAGSGSAQWETLHKTATRTVAAFPDSIAAWHQLAFLEHVLRGETDRAAQAQFAERLATFDAKIRVAVPSAEADARLMRFAQTIGDTQRAQFWRARLERDDPRHPQAVLARAVDIIGRYRGTSMATDRWREALPAMEALWNDGGYISDNVATFGYQLSMWANDADALSRWGPRYIASDSSSMWTAYAVAQSFTRHASLRAQGMDMLRRLLQPVDSVHTPLRPLAQTVADFTRSRAELRGSMLQALGEALLVDRQPVAARDTLRLAGQHGWNLTRFRSLADATLRSGDTASAARAYALVAADPETPKPFEQVALNHLGWSSRDARWKAAQAIAPDTLLARVLSTSTRLPLDIDSLDVTDATGRRLSFASVARNRITVVAFGLELSERSPLDLVRMQELSDALQRDGHQLITFALRDRPADADRKLKTLGIRFRVLFDDAHNAQRAFEANGFPMYFVLDANGDIRFAYSDLGKVRMQAHALATIPREVR